MKKNLLRLENKCSKLKKYDDYGDIEYRGIREIKSLIEDYYKPIRTNQ